MKLVSHIFNTLLLLLILCNTANASHVSGGDITYTCVGPNQYEITLKLYRDCSGITMSTTASVSFTNSCGLVNPSNLSLTLRNPNNTGVNCTPVSSCNTEVSQLCPSQTSNSSCNGGSLPGMQEYIYKGMVTFPAPCNSWTIAYSLNARNSSVNVSNSQTLDFYVETTMSSVNDPCNNSAYFTAQPIPYVCVNNPVSYNLGVVDPDADSLYFTLISAKSGPSTNVTYNAGYSGAAPIPGITINNTTGQINFTPTMIGNFIVVVQVEEFDINGISLGTVSRDFQFVVQSCSNTPPDPSGGAITNFSGTATQTGNFTIEMCEGQNFSFDAVFNDPNAGDSLSMTTNITSVLTGSTFSSSGSNPLTGSFSWTAPAGSGGSFSFVVTINDGACPVPGINSFTYTVDVITATSAGPDKYYCPAGGPVQLQASGGSSFNWSPSTGLSCTNCSNPLASPSATTTYVVTSNLASGCINTDTITVFVVPDFTLTVTDDTTICRNQNVLLQATGSPSSFAPFTYSWDPSTSLSSTNSSTTYANPQLTETFYVTATSNTGCTIRDSVTVTINGEAPIVFATTDKDVVCAGEQVQLSTAFMQPCGIVEYPCTGPSDVVEVGTGTFGSTIASPFYGGLLLPSKKIQFIYPASEIAATTGGGKNITALAFNITSLPATPTSGVINIKIGCTNQGEFTTYTDDFIEGLVPVKTNYLFTPVVGWNTIVLDDTYRWDGSSDIAVEICTDIGFSASLSTAYTSTSPRYYTLYRTNANSGLACLDSTGTRTTSRANIRFTMCDAVPTTSYSYSWTPTTGLSDPTIPNPTATINNSIIYQVNVTELANPQCVGNDTVAIFIDSTNYVTAVPDTAVCPGDTVQLNAIVSGPQPSASIPCGTNNTTCAGTPYQATIGTGTTFNSQTQYPAPYGNWYWGAKHQILYTAADLIAAGMQSGTISELAFNVASLNTSTTVYQNVEIKMGCTNTSNLTSWETGLSTVYNNPSYTVTTGWNTHVFDNSFDWDGTSNIIVEFCFNNSSYTRNVSTYWTTTPYTSVLRTIGDNPNVCSSTASPVSSSNRPNIRFTTCDAPPIVLSYNWSPAGDVSDPNIQNPTAVIPGPGSSTFVVNVTGTKCALYDTLTITIDTNATPVISASGPTTFCQGDSVILTSSSPTGNTWSTGATTQSITVTTSGSYTVSGGCGGGSSPAVIVTVNPNDTLTLTSTAGTDTQTVCINTPITDITYSVTGGGTGASASGLPAGVNGNFASGTFTISGTPTQSGIFNYTVTTTGSCTPDSATGTITVNPAPTVVASNDTAICNGSSATISASGASSYTWDNSLGTGQSHTVSPTTTTTYVVTGTDANSCENTDTVIITVNPLPIIDSIPFTNESACGANDGSITIYATGSGLTYSIDNGATFVASNSFTALAAGSYNVVVQSANGCLANGGVISISSAGAPAAPTASISPNPACEGDSLTLTVTNPVPGETYNWTGPNAYSDAGQTVGIANTTPTMSGAYTVTASVGSCVSPGTTINVTINPNDVINLSSAAGSDNQAICQNESITTISYSVTGGGTGASASGLPAGVTGSFAGGVFTISGTPTVVGSFNYTVITSGVCSPDTALGNITINPPPTLVASASATSICAGDPVTLTGSGASSYSWDNSLGNGQSHTVNPTTTTTYVVTGTDTNSCLNTDSITITVTNCNQPHASFTASAMAICQGDSITFTNNSSGSSITNWNWTFGGGSPNSANTQGPHTVVFNNSGSFNITLQITDANGIDDTTITVTVNPLPTVTANASATSICAGDPVTLSASGASSYSWDNSLGNGQSHTVNPTTTTTYTVTGTDTNGCQNTDMITVTVTNCNQPVASFTASAMVICQGDSITFTDNSSGSSITNWNWTFGGGSPNSANTQGPHTVVFNNSGSFNITLQITDANGIDDTTITVTVNPLPTVTANASANTICAGDPVTLTGSGASSYSWDNGLGNGQSHTVSPTTTTTYTVTGTDANGCQNTDNITITVTNPNSTTQTFVECQGFSVTVGANTYNSTGTYIDIVGCDTTITNLTINPNPQITLIKADDNCGTNTGSISANLVAGATPVTYYWSNGSSDSTLNNLPAGVYSVTVTDANGCAANNNVVINDLEIDCEYFVYVPNVFSPNNDGNNDLLFVYGDGILSLSMKIYNRWGNKVFEITDVNQGWNGKYKGQEQNTAVFVYVLDVTFINGKSVSQSGNISLVK